jgi:PleD family two-component response regulator
MHLKLRPRIPRRPLFKPAKTPSLISKPHRFNVLYQPDILSGHTLKLAADVHPSPLENCSETSVVLKKVLIVDDSPSQVRLIQGLLEPEGYEPIGLNDPKRIEEAIAREVPRIILLDVIMPERNGFKI